MERRRNSLVSWRGRDEYNRFAEALGATLPRITDSSIESSAAATSEGDTEYLELTDTTEELEAGKRTPVERSIPEKKTIIKEAMAGLMKMSSFVGRGDGKENPSDYIADGEMAAQLWDATVGQNSNGADASKITLFRQNLNKDGDAWHWWTQVLSEEAKGSFEEIKKAFLERYGTERNKAISRFNVQNELMLLRQRDGQSIAEYVREAESLSDRVPGDMDNMLAMVFVRGLADQETRRRVSYDLRDKPEFTFRTALNMVKSWYQEIGAPDPFRLNSVGFNSYGEESVPPVYAKPLSGTVQTAREGMGGVAKATAGVETGLPSQEVFNRMMLNFMETMKQDFRISPHRTPGVINTASGAGMQQGRDVLERGPEARTGRISGGVICFNCGGNGHFSTGCTNTPLTYAEQKRIREQFRSNRDTRAQGDRKGNTNSERVTVLSTANKTRDDTESVVATRVVTANVELGSRVTEVRDEEEDGVTKESMVSCIKVVSVAADKGIVGHACATLMRMPAVAAVFEKAMVDKRVRVDDDYEQPGCASKQPRTERPTTRSGTTASSGSRPAPTPEILTDSTPEPESESEEDTPIVLERPRARIEVPAAQEHQESQTQPAEQPANKKKPNRKVTKPAGPVPPINWMRGQKQYSLQDALNEVTPKISFLQLLDVSPRLRRELAELLRSSVPRTRGKGKGKERAETASVALAKNTPVILTEAHSDDEVNCFYIDAWIGNRLVGDVLIDGGAMLDLISKDVVESLKLEKLTVRGLGMRLADDSLVRLDHYV